MINSVDKLLFNKQLSMFTEHLFRQIRLLKGNSQKMKIIAGMYPDNLSADCFRCKRL